MPPPIGPGEPGHGSPRYSQQDFCEDFGVLVQLIGLPELALVQAQREHFASKYLDPLDRAWRLTRCIAALKYWAKHQLSLGSLDPCHTIIASVSPGAQRAFWICWGNEEIDPVSYDPPFEEFLKLCAQNDG